MAERQRTGGTRQGRPRTRRLASRDEQEAADEDEWEAADEEVADEDAAEPASWDESSDDGGRAARQDGSSLTAREAARAALRQIMELTAKRAEGITGVERTEDGWSVDVEVVEDRRIPSSADILATYQATIDGDGELMSYRRVRRYSRGRGD